MPKVTQLINGRAEIPSQMGPLWCWPECPQPVSQRAADGFGEHPKAGHLENPTFSHTES